MGSARTMRALPIAVTGLLLLSLALARTPIGEIVEGPGFSTALAVVGGLVIGTCLVVALGAGRSRA